MKRNEFWKKLFSTFAVVPLLAVPVLGVGCDDDGPDEAIEEIEDEVDDLG